MPCAGPWQSSRNLKGKNKVGKSCCAGQVSQVCHGGSSTVPPEPAMSLGCGQALGPTPCSGLRLWCLEMGVARDRQYLTAPCFWQVPASSTTASFCWSARIHPWPGPLPAACPRSPVSHPWPSPASSSWRSSRSGMRAKKPCQIKTSLRWTSEFPAPRPQAMAGPVPGPRGGAGTVTSWLQPSLMLGMDM